MSSTKKKSEFGLSKDLESHLIWGPYPNEVRETLSKASSIVDKYASLDPEFVLYLLREQTWIAMNWPTREHRKIEQAWAELCHGLERFLAAAFGTKTVNEIKRTFQKAKRAAKEEGRKLEFREQPEDLTSKPSDDLRKALGDYSDKLSLPSYEDILSGRPGGRPQSWSDAVALAMKQHFQEKFRSPRWKIIGQLLSCAPPMEGLSMEHEKIRQRLDQKENRPPRVSSTQPEPIGRTHPTLAEDAFEITRRYTLWAKAGRKGPCPSLLHPSSFRDPASDTSLSEEDFAKHAANLYKKYPEPQKTWKTIEKNRAR